MQLVSSEADFCGDHLLFDRSNKQHVIRIICVWGKKSVAASEGYFCIPKCVLLTMQYTDLLLNLSVLAIFT